MSFVSLRRSLAAVLAAVALASVAVGPVAAQSSSTEPSAPSITVTAMDHHFDGLPSTMPAGTTLTMTNSGAEVHELLVARRNDGVTESWDELISLPQDQVVDKVTILGPLFAGPGETAEGSIVLDQAGDYIALCFVPQGMTSMPGPDATMDPALAEALPHVALGMRQEFTVTDAGPSPSAPATSRVIALEMDAALQIKENGTQVKVIPVTIGETITFQITNTAGYAHNFWIGTDQQLSTAQTEGLPGVPEYSTGVAEFTWVVPENVAELRFGCTVPGHYQLMQGSFSIAG